MRHAALLLLLASPAFAFDTEARGPYRLRVVVRTADHPTLTEHFRGEVKKAIQGSLEAGLGSTGTVEVVDFNTMPADQRDPLLKLAAERGIEGIDGVTAAYGPKTHFVWIDFVDNKYEIRTRQHCGSSGLVTPFVRRTVHPDRGFVGRLAGLAIAQDFGTVGTFDPPEVGKDQLSVVLKAGELGSMDGWVKKGDVFAVTRVSQAGRATPKATPKGKKDEPSVPLHVGTRVEGVLIQAVDAPRNGVVACKFYTRYRGGLPRDALTAGYRAVKLGTAEGPLKLQLVNAAGTPFRLDTLQPRAGGQDYPDTTPRDREEMTFADGVFTSKEPFKNIAFVLVRAGEASVARIPVEIYEGQVAIRKVDPKQALIPPATAVALDLQDRIRSARLIQVRCFEEVVALQKKEKQKALEFGESAYKSLQKEADVLRVDLSRLRERHKSDAPAGLFDPADVDLRTLEGKTKELAGHLVTLREVIRKENDPAAVGARKGIEGALLEAEGHVKQADYDQAIAKYEEALKLAESDAKAKEAIQTIIDGLKKVWEVKDEDHAGARKFVYEVWTKLEKPAEVRERFPEARKAFEKCKAVGDRITLLKMHAAGPALLQRYKESLEALTTEFGDDPDRKSELEAYVKLNDDLKSLLTDIGKSVAVEGK